MNVPWSRTFGELAKRDPSRKIFCFNPSTHYMRLSENRPQHSTY
jgi:hypothetical protein